jgi:hypothetical protein
MWPCEPVNDANGKATDPHIKARCSVMDIEVSDVGTYEFARSVPILSCAPELWKDPSPNLGKHIRVVLKGLFRISSDDITLLAKQKVIQVTILIQRAVNNYTPKYLSRINLILTSTYHTCLAELATAFQFTT